MQLSSLVFVVIVAIWVAYLVQHWVSRREHLATARSVDKFSEAMRVLERRNPLPTTMLATASPPGGGTASSRPEVTVKHAGAPSPLRARTRGDSPLPPAHDIPPVELVPHRTQTQILLRRVRGLLFLASIIAVPTCLVLSAAHILKWISVWISLAVLVGVTVWLRVAAIRDQAARRARRAAHRQLAESRARVGETSIRGRHPSEEVQAATRTVVSTPRSRAATAAPVARASTGKQAPTVEASPDAGTEVEARTADDAPGGWQPVPVPRPTYQLKDPAHPRESTRPTTEGPVPIEVEDELAEVPAARPRRVVGS